jgi:hypothetical protein
MTVAARKTGDKWEAALVQDGRFMRAFQGAPYDSLAVVVNHVMFALLDVNRNEGTEVSVNITVSEPDAQ